MKIHIEGKELECVKGDITKQYKFDAVVNAANAQLMPGGGVAGAIHKAAGPGLARECRHFAPIETGEAVVTSGHSLSNEYVVHALGPVYGREKDAAGKLAECYKNSLEAAEASGIESVAFPALSTGAFGYPVEEAAEVALKAIMDVLPQLKRVKRVRFVLWSEKDLKTHERILKELAEK